MQQRRHTGSKRSRRRRRAAPNVCGCYYCDPPNRRALTSMPRCVREREALRHA